MSHKDRAPTTRERYHVHDPRELAALIGKALEERYSGSALKAGCALAGARHPLSSEPKSSRRREARANQRLLSRMLKMENKSLSRPKFELLRRLLPEYQRQRLELFVLPPSAYESLQLYKKWIGATNPWIALAKEGPDRWTTLAKRISLLEIDELMRELRARFPGQFNGFDRFLREKEVDPERAQIAFYRVVEPLLQFQASGFIELDWTEIPREDLQRYLKAAFMKQQILLMRPTNVKRATEVSASLKPETYINKKYDLALKIADEEDLFRPGGPSILASPYGSLTPSSRSIW